MLKPSISPCNNSFGCTQEAVEAQIDREHQAEFDSSSPWVISFYLLIVFLGVIVIAGIIDWCQEAKK